MQKPVFYSIPPVTSGTRSHERFRKLGLFPLPEHTWPKYWSNPNWTYNFGCATSEHGDRAQVAHSVSPGRMGPSNIGSPSNRRVWSQVVARRSFGLGAFGATLSQAPSRCRCRWRERRRGGKVWWPGNCFCVLTLSPLFLLDIKMMGSV